MRGGLIAPAVDMGFSGLSPAALVASWKSRGADETMFEGPVHEAVHDRHYQGRGD